VDGGCRSFGTALTLVLNLVKIISGGQTGVDQSALRAAVSCGFAIGGWCPPGRVCDDGVIPNSFPLEATPEDRSPDRPDIPRSQRSEWNVRDSDATLILWPSALHVADSGTRWTAECASRYQKPLLTCDPADPAQVVRVQDWTSQHRIATLNVAGPSEASSPGIGALAERFIREVLSVK
jgi:Circularly permutated YpsA SLOG family